MTLRAIRSEMIRLSVFHSWLKKVIRSVFFLETEINDEGLNFYFLMQIWIRADIYHFTQFRYQRPDCRIIPNIYLRNQ